MKLRRGSEGGGVAIITHQDVRSVHLREYDMVGLEAVWADVSCSIQQSSCYTCYTEDSCRPAIIDSCQKQLSQISFHTLSFQKI